MTSPEERIRTVLVFLYGEQNAQELWPRLKERLQAFSHRNSHLKEKETHLDQTDAILIAYADHVQQAGYSPLVSLAGFLEQHLAGALSSVHLLPFYPWSSDDGFSVIDYRQVSPVLGNWDDIANLGQRYRLMFDAVINHVSRQSAWFQSFLQGDKPYQDYFITVDPTTDLSGVVRPRTLPLLTPVQTAHGTKHVWTTFSDDQIDLNYANPQVLLEILALLLFYAQQGAEFIRLDAIAYLWKKTGSPCIHLDETHAVIKLMRAVLDLAAPGVILITETNVPHAENISYFGQPLAGRTGTDEAQMIYSFPLAPLVLHTFHTGSTRALVDWVTSLPGLPAGTAFFNFLASHDGIGVRPAEGLLSPDQIHAIVEKTLEHGGKVSYKTNTDGTQSPYELNTTWYDALNDPHRPSPEIDVRRFLASQAIMLSLAGVPGIYAHSLFGSRNCHECFQATGRARSVNREKFQRIQLESELKDRNSLTAQVFSGYRQLLLIRREQAAFHPQAGQRVLLVGAGVFAILRLAPDLNQSIICLVEAAGHTTRVQIDLTVHSLPAGEWQELLTGQRITPGDNNLEVTLPAYGVMWLRSISPS